MERIRFGPYYEPYTNWACSKKCDTSHFYLYPITFIVNNISFKWLLSIKWKWIHLCLGVCVCVCHDLIGNLLRIIIIFIAIIPIWPWFPSAYEKKKNTYHRHDNFVVLCFIINPYKFSVLIIDLIDSVFCLGSNLFIFFDVNSMIHNQCALTFAKWF